MSWRGTASSRGRSKSDGCSAPFRRLRFGSPPPESPCFLGPLLLATRRARPGLGNRGVTREDVKSYLREKVGQPFVPEALSKDVRELWGSGFFDDVEVDLDRTDAGVRLRFTVRERSNIAKVEFDDNDEIDDDDL